ncbi:chemotaxis protein CheW [Guyparkeria halophila]|uniref:Chemotaxis protein CheW n=1 Tax=Guyparkeria halophila TaxID=47960 RepID=A0ABZ0YXS5_9GAMM|nr:chemotaxis protein CheW [Guyparkeria halophila]WQH16965.1 chemotaxis protein CheW [Guyparkeria halophila]
MAAEKQHDSRQPIVDQDAAITAYLDGLLRDPDADEATEGSAPRKSPGLKVINVPDSPAASAPPVEESPAAAGDDVPSGSAATDAVPHAPDIDSSTSSTEPEEMGEVADGVGVPEPVAAEMPVEQAPVAVAETVDPTEASPEADPTPAEASDSSQAAEDACWGWLRIGGMTMAIPADAIDSRHPEPALEPVPGAPSQVAGSLSLEGRPRLILSLAAVTGLRERADAETEVFLLGKGGLWGVAGERVEQPPELNDESVEWRNETQRAARRQWLAGTASAAGVAVLDVAGLRAALKASR